MIEVPKIVGTVPQMIHKTLDYLRTNVIKQRIIKPKDRAESIKFFNYPYQAFEEAVVNALYHRDYQEREPVEITIEPDKVSILSYSGPDRSISIEAIQKAERLKSRRYRNRRLGDYLKELQLSEGRATGIPTIQDELRKNGSLPARIETDDNRSYFLLEIPCRNGFETINETINENELIVFLAIAKNQGVKRAGLTKVTGMKLATIIRILKNLISEPLNLIEYKGSRKTGGYILTEKGEQLFADKSSNTRT